MANKFQTLTAEEQEIVDGAKSAYLKATGDELTLDAETILKIDGDTATMDDALEAFASAMDESTSEPEDQDEASVSVSLIDEDAKKAASYIATDSALLAEVAEFTNAKEKLKRLPASVAYYMRKDIPKQTFVSYPYPGSEYDPEDPSQPYDTYSRKKDKKTGSWWRDVYLCLPLAAPTLAALEAHEKLKDSMDSEEWRTEKARLNQQLTNGAGVVKLAAKIIFQMLEVEQKLAPLSADFRTQGEGEDEKVKRTTSPIVVVMPDRNPAKTRIKFMSVGSFLNVVVDDVAKTNDFFTNFKAERETGNGAPAASVSIATLDQFLSGLPDIAICSRDTKFTADLMARANKAFSKNEDDRDEGRDIIAQMFETGNWFDRFLSKPEYRKVWAEIQNEQAKQAKDAA